MPKRNRVDTSNSVEERRRYAEFLARNTDPISCVVGGQVDQPHQRGIDGHLGDSNKPEDRRGEARDIDRCEIANRAELLVAYFNDPRSLRSISMDRLMNSLPD